MWRGKPAAHIVFGQAQAINSANYMFVEAVRRTSMLRSSYAIPILLDALELVSRPELGSLLQT